MIIELAGTSVEYIVEPLTEQLTASLKRGEDRVPANCKYVLENCELHLCQIHHKDSCEQLFDVLQELSDQCLEDSRWVHQIYRKTMEATLNIIVPDAAGSSERAATSALPPNSIPNLFHAMDYKMSFGEVLDWLGNSEKVTNLLMFFEGLWTWMLSNNYRHLSPAEVLPRLVEIKENRGWAHVQGDWLNMWKCENNYLFSIIKSNERLCALFLFMEKWEAFSSLRKFHNIRSIFERESELYFDIRGSPALDIRNCLSHGKCALLLKTVPAKDGANVVLCTDPAEYPDNMHFHKEFQAKNMHLTAYFTKPKTAYLPLSWLGTPVIKNGSVFWNEIFSKSNFFDTVCHFRLFVWCAQNNDQKIV